MSLCACRAFRSKDMLTRLTSDFGVGINKSVNDCEYNSVIDVN